MADMPPIVIELQAKTDQLRAGLAEVESQVKALGGATDASAKHVEGFSSKLKELGKVAAEAFAVAELVKFFGESIKEASAASQSFAAFGVTMKNVTGASKEQTEAMRNQLNEMALVSNQVGADLVPSFDKLLSVTGNAKQATQLLSLAQNVAAAKHVDVATAANALAKAASGQFTALSRLAPETKNVSDKFELLAKNTKGAAEAAGNADPIAKLQATFKEIQESLGEAFLPLLQQLAQLLIQLMPIIGQVASFIGKLLAAVSPIVQALGNALLPVVGSLMNAFMSLVQVLEPVLFPILQALLPIIDLVAAAIIGVANVVAFLAKGFEAFAKILMNAVGAAIQSFIKQFGPLGSMIENLFNGLMKLAGIKPIKLDISTTTPDFAKFDAGTFAGLDAKAVPTSTSGSSAKSKAAAALEKHKKAVADFTQKMKDAAAKVASAVDEYDSKVADAYQRYTDKTADITNTFNDAMTAATAQRDADMQQLEQDHASKLLQIQSDYSSKLNDVIQQSMNLIRSAFASASQMDIGSMFSASLSNSTLASTLSTQVKNGLTTVVSWWGSPASGGGVTGLLKSMQDKLAASKALSDNAAKLAGAGFSQNFIDQVLAQGTDVGNTMASAILSAGPDTQKALQSTFTEAESFTAHGVDSLAQKLYDTQGLASESLKSMWSQTLKDQADALTAENDAYTASQAKIQKTFDDAVTKATDARDKAMKAAQDALDKSLTSAEDSLNKSLASIEASVEKTIAKMGNLNKSASSAVLSSISGATVGTYSVPMVNTAQGQMSFSAADASGITVVNNIATSTNATAADIAASTANAAKLSLPYIISSTTSSRVVSL
jgi:hypothetical protein